jgi:hypothetical protein
MSENRRNTLEDYVAEIAAHKKRKNCDWCVGFIRRDCTMFNRCMKPRDGLA